jgi:hypothetical protein
VAEECHKKKPYSSLIPTGLLVIVVTIVTKHPSDSLNPVLEDAFQFAHLSLLEKYYDRIEKLFWSIKRSSKQSCIHIAKERKIRRC